MKNINSGGVKSGKMSTRIDTYDPDYSPDKFGGKFPLVETLLFLGILGMIGLFIWKLNQ